MLAVSAFGQSAKSLSTTIVPPLAPCAAGRNASANAAATTNSTFATLPSDSLDPTGRPDPAISRTRTGSCQCLAALGEESAFSDGAGIVGWFAQCLVPACG